MDVVSEKVEIEPVDHEPLAVNLFNDLEWQYETMMGNKLLDERKMRQALTHYNTALTMSKVLFEKYKSDDIKLDALIPIIVISFLNLADFWAAKGDDNNAINYLIQAFDFLVDAFKSMSLADDLKVQLSQGINRVYPELVIRLKESGDIKTLNVKKSTLLRL